MAKATGHISRRMSSIAAAISFCVLILSRAAFATSDIQPGQTDSAPAVFHSPDTEAERALDAILKLSDQEPGSSWFAVKAPWREKADDVKFQGLFSKVLMDSWAEAERTAVEINCDGHYIDGENCGIDIHPITCAQDSVENYIYRTIASSSADAIIEYGWPQSSKPIATFRLLRNDDGWVLDGVACTGYLRFNMP